MGNVAGNRSFVHRGMARYFNGMTEHPEKPANDHPALPPGMVIISVSSEVGRTVRYVAKWGFIALCGYEFAQAFTHFAGQETDIKLALSAWIETKAGLTISMSLSLAVLGMGYGNWQNRLRKRAVERMGTRISQLERLHDPSRTSSGLLTDGTVPRPTQDD